jgi:ABC-type nitrate/sulfonate/bicarbonate transport system ATPase subunit
LTSAISVRHVTHRYGDVTALDDIGIEVGAGEFIAVIGPSGCGKSTLLRMLAGLLTPTEGAVLMNDVDVTGTPGVAAYMPQHDALLPWRRALANTTLGAKVAGLDAETTDARALELFERFGLSGFEKSWPHQLSGGMRQRVAVLRTILTPFPVLLLDEPFGSLDAITRHNMQRWLEEVWRDDGRATVLVTHDIDEALTLADRVLVMSRRPGGIVLELNVHLARPRTPEVTVSPEFVQLKRTLLNALGG